MTRPGPKLAPLDLTDAERLVLEGWVRRRKSAQDMAMRARVILACDDVGEDGFPVSTRVVMERVGVSRDTRLDKDRGPDPRITGRILPTNYRLRTLVLQQDFGV